MEWQEIIMLIFGAGLSALGWFARELWQAVQDMKAQHNALAVEIPTRYVNKAEYQLNMQRIEKTQNEQFNKIDAKLDRMLDKLEMKADK